MATKTLKDIKVNNFRVIFGIVNGKYLLAIPDASVSGYFKTFNSENKYDNTILLTDLFKNSGFRNSVFSHVVIEQVTEIWERETIK